MKKKKIVILGIVILLLAILLASPFLYWKRAGIRNKIYDTFGIKYTPIYGSYNQVVKVTADMSEKVVVTDDVMDAQKIVTTIPTQESRVVMSEDIDAQIAAELESGYDTWETPLAILDPYQNAPLTGMILFTTEEPCGVRVTVKGHTENADIIGETPETQMHRVPVVGLYPSFENTVVLELLDDKGKVTDSQEILMQTEGVPGDLEDAVQPVVTSGESAYALTAVYGEGCKYPFAYDCNGDLRWYLNEATGTYGMYMLSDGHFIIEGKTGYLPTRVKPQPTDFYEMDYLGRVFHKYVVPNGAHHEIIEKEPGGNLLCLTSSLENHVEDAILEMDRNTGEIVNSLVLSEVFGKTYVNKVDWAHINTVSYQADADTILISARNLHSVMKINWTTHELQWILADPVFWADTDFASYVLEPEGDITWNYQQHSAYQIAADLDGNPDTAEISIFDNHSATKRGISTYENVNQSFARVLLVDEVNHKVTQLRNFPLVYSELTSNTAYDVPSGHIFGMCGWILDEDGTQNYDGRFGMTYEFDFESEELVNQFSIRKRFYRANKVNLNYESLSAPMEVQENKNIGSLRPAVETDKWVFPAFRTAVDEIPMKVEGNVLYLTAKEHTISQVIFKGKQKTYVYDLTTNQTRITKYLGLNGNLPIPLTNLEPDEYQILCVYKNKYYKMADSLTIAS